MFQADAFQNITGELGATVLGGNYYAPLPSDAPGNNVTGALRVGTAAPIYGRSAQESVAIGGSIKFDASMSLDARTSAETRGSSIRFNARVYT